MPTTAAEPACRCPAPHDVLKATPELWQQLAPSAGGNQVVADDEDGPGFVVELRDCPCGSTLGVILPREQRPVAPLAAAGARLSDSG